MGFIDAGNQPLSVSAAINRANKALSALPLCVQGEVSEVSNKPGYKAVYFTIKDESSALPCMMWVNRYQASGVVLRAGVMVKLTGKLSIYAAKGRMTFDVNTLELAGEGDLRQKIALLAKKLQAEGLMDDARKRPLPIFPQVIGVVTSPRGAAVHDVLRTLRRRFPLARVVFSGVPVEGAGAAQNIIRGLEACVKAQAEVCLVVRGGGSLEDLMPFNDEALARAISACPVPVVTGIGHEPDTTIADLVADRRASTPTAAAEAVSPSSDELRQIFESYSQHLNVTIRNRQREWGLQVKQRITRPLFQDSAWLFGQANMGLDLAARGLMTAIPGNIRRDALAIERAADGLSMLPKILLGSRGLQVEQRAKTLSKDQQSLLAQYDAALGQNAALLQSLSPLSVLGRGYSITYAESGHIVKASSDVSIGDTLHVKLGSGALEAAVTSIHSEK